MLYRVDTSLASLACLGYTAGIRYSAIHTHYTTQLQPNSNCVVSMRCLLLPGGSFDILPLKESTGSQRLCCLAVVSILTGLVLSPKK